MKKDGKKIDAHHFHPYIFPLCILARLFACKTTGKAIQFLSSLGKYSFFLCVSPNGVGSPRNRDSTRSKWGGNSFALLVGGIPRHITMREFARYDNDVWDQV
jgi:hypothetical protein